MRWTKLLTYGKGYPVAVVATCAAAAALMPARAHLQPSTVMLAMVPVIIAVAWVAGLRASTTSAVLGFLLLDVLFVPPYYRLRVASPSEWIALAVFLVVALVSGRQTARVRERERDALDRRRELEMLNRLAFRLTSEHSALSTAQMIVEEVVSVLGADRAALYGGPGPVEPACLAEFGERRAVSAEVAMASWVVHNSKAIGLSAGGLPPGEQPASVGPADAIPDVVADGVYVPLLTGYGLEGVLYVRGVPGALAEDRHRRLVVAIANLAAASLGRQRVAEITSRTAALSDADRLKTTLVSSVSHELKTPLSAAVVRISGLLEGDMVAEDPVRVHSELATALDDLMRLDASIGDLIDMSRLESDAWRPRFEEHDLSDVLGTVLSRVPAELRERVRFELPEDLPPVQVDFSQIARALLNVVENALTYSPAGSAVTVGARELAGDTLVWVSDLGPGVPDPEKARVFGRFFRGSAASGSAGTGLGLTIAAEIAHAHGGRLWVEDNVPCGARFVMALPRTPRAGG